MKGLTELNVFRGTYKEVQAKETRDMTIYLAWDTQEIFIGNSLGTKVKYGSGASPDKGLKAYFATFKDSLYDEVKNYSHQQVEDRVNELLNQIVDKYDTAKQELVLYKGQLSEELKSELSSLEKDLSNAVKDYNDQIRNLSESLNKKIDSSVELINKDIDSVRADYTEKISGLEKVIDEEVEGAISQLEKDLEGNYYTKDRINSQYYTKTEIDNQLAEMVFGEDIQMTLGGYVTTDTFENYKSSASSEIKNASSAAKTYTDTKVADVQKTVTKLIDGAPTAYDTLREIAGYIESDKTAASEMLASINRNASAISDVTSKVDTDFYTKGEVDTKITDAVTGGKVDLSNYYTKPETRSQINSSLSVETKARQDAINSIENNLNENYYTSIEVDNKIKNATPNIDLSSYATTSYVDNKVANSGFATETYVNNKVLNSGFVNEEYVDSKIENISLSASDISYGGSTVDKELDSKLDVTIAEKTYATKSDLENISVSGNSVTYMFGDDIFNYVASLEKVSDFKPTFCIVDATKTDDYLAGNLYYYDPDIEEIVSVSTGGTVELTEIISNLYLSTTNTDPSGADNIYEINSVPLQVSVTASADNTDAISGDVILSIGGNSEVIDVSNKQTVQKNTSLPRTSTKTYYINLSASAKAATKKYKYTVNTKSKSYTFYQPNFIGTDETSLIKLGNKYKGTWGPEYTSNDTTGKTLYMYTTGKISSITMSGFGYSYSLEDSSYKLTVNGVECTYYKYNLGSVYSELADIVVS